MNAALEVPLETGQHLLITNAADSLSWNREEQLGWGVALYRASSEYDDGPVVFECTDDNTDTSTEALLRLVRTVLSAETLRRPAGA